MEGQKRAKLDMGVFLEQLRRMVVEDNSLERMVARCANGAANYLELLGRTYILFDCIQRGKQDDFAHQMQCRAKDTSNSSMIQQPRALYKLWWGWVCTDSVFWPLRGPTLSCDCSILAVVWKRTWTTILKNWNGGWRRMVFSPPKRGSWECK